MIRIKQCRMSPILRFFAPRFLAKYNLAPYHSPTQPAVFFGCYLCGSGRFDVATIAAHRALGIVILGGSDAMNLKKNIKKYRPILSKRNLRFLAMSQYVSNDLAQVGIPHVLLPVCPAPLDNGNVASLGPNVYAYSAHGRPDFYGEPIIQDMARRMPQFKFRICYSEPPNSYLPNQLKTIYKDCFIGLRLTPHDGLPNTVIELGLMGRRCIWNGRLPNTIQWKTADDVQRIILAESAKIGTRQTEVAQQLYDYLNIGDDWLSTNYWK